MKDKFEGAEGRTYLLEALLEQKVVEGNRDLAVSIMDKLELSELQKGDTLIEKGVEDDFIYLILAGAFDVRVYNKLIARRLAGFTAGEMAAIQPRQPRSATVVATEASVVGKISQADLGRIGDAYPQVWRFFAKDLARRLLQRNSLLAAPRGKIRVLVLASAEGLDAARAVHDAFARDPYTIEVWTGGLFRTANYLIEDLEEQLDQSDFVVAIAPPDDSRAGAAAAAFAARDKVLFEIGFAMGRLGRKRAILLEPAGAESQRPADLSGLTTVTYHHVQGAGMAEAMVQACGRIRDHIKELGPND